MVPVPFKSVEETQRSVREGKQPAVEILDPPQSLCLKITSKVSSKAEEKCQVGADVFKYSRNQ